MNWEKLPAFGHFHPGRVCNFHENAEPSWNQMFDAQFPPVHRLVDLKYLHANIFTAF